MDDNTLAAICILIDAVVVLAFMYFLNKKDK